MEDALLWRSVVRLGQEDAFPLISPNFNIKNGLLPCREFQFTCFLFKKKEQKKMKRKRKRKKKKKKNEKEECAVHVLH